MKANRSFEPLKLGGDAIGISLYRFASQCAWQNLDGVLMLNT